MNGLAGLWSNVKPTDATFHRNWFQWKHKEYILLTGKLSSEIWWPLRSDLLAWSGHDDRCHDDRGDSTMTGAPIKEERAPVNTLFIWFDRDDLISLDFFDLAKSICFLLSSVTFNLILHVFLSSFWCFSVWRDIWSTYVAHQEFCTGMPHSSF